MTTNITASELGINIEKKERELFKWFLASYLFGKRIQQEAARDTYELFMKHGIDTPKKISEQTCDQLVELLEEGNYRRHDQSTAHGLLEMAHTLVHEYHGNLLNMFSRCASVKEFTHQLQSLKGFEPNAIKLFMSEAEPVLVGAN